MTTRRQVDLPVEGFEDLLVDAPLIEHVGRTGVAAHPGHQIGRYVGEVLLDLLVGLGPLDDDLAEVLIEKVADDADHQVGLGRQHGRRTAPDHLGLNVLPLGLQALHVPGKVLLGGALGSGPDDHARAVRHKVLEDVAQPPTLHIGELAGDARRVTVGHVHQMPAGQRDMAGEARALVPDRILGDLHQHGLTRLEGLFDRACPALEPGGIPVDLTRVEHRVAPATNIDEGRFHAGEHVLHLAEVYVAHHGCGGLPGHVMLDQNLVLQHGHLSTVATLPHDHHPVHRLAASQELRLGQDGRRVRRCSRPSRRRWRLASSRVDPVTPWTSSRG